MLRNGRPTTAILVLALSLWLAAAGCGGEDEEPAAPEGVAFAVYDSEGQVGEPADEGSLRCGPPRALCPPELIEPTGTYRYEPSGGPALDASHSDGARVQESEGQPLVIVELTPEGTKAFRELTRSLAERGREAERNQHAAVVVGDEVVAVAPIDYQQHAQGIETTSLQFFGAGDADATAIAERINAG